MDNDTTKQVCAISDIYTKKIISALDPIIKAEDAKPIHILGFFLALINYSAAILGYLDIDHRRAMIREIPNMLKIASDNFADKLKNIGETDGN